MIVGTDSELVERMDKLVKNEAETLVLLLEHIGEIDARSIPLEVGYKSTFAVTTPPRSGTKQTVACGVSFIGRHRPNIARTRTSMHQGRVVTVRVSLGSLPLLRGRRLSEIE